MKIAFRGRISPGFAKPTALNSVPIIYATAVFTTIAGMRWSSLTTQRAGVNSSIGIVPVRGIIPILAIPEVWANTRKKSFNLLSQANADSLVLSLSYCPHSHVRNFN